MRPNLSLARLERYSECLHALYDEPTGEDPVTAVLNALDRLLPIDSMSVNETRGDGQRLTHQRALANWHPELMDARPGIIAEVAHDHPLIRHVLRHGPSPCLKLSDFVTQRQLRGLSLYAFNSRRHRWRDQAALMVRTGGGTVSFALNRDRVFTAEEFVLLHGLQRHAARVLSRGACFVRLPGREQLTIREREVLHWIMQGKRDEEISIILACAERTVRQHTRAILRKLEVENRATAVSAVLSGRAGNPLP